MIEFRESKALKRGLLVASAMFLVLQVSPAQAQLPPGAEDAARSSGSAERVQESLEEKMLSPEVSPSLEVGNLILQEVPPGAENIRFTLREVRLEGRTSLSPSMPTRSAPRCRSPMSTAFPRR
jgi:hypothetical protein